MWWFKSKEGQSIFDSASPRLTFWLGLVSGLAALGLVGFFIILGVLLFGNNGIKILAKAPSQVATADVNQQPAAQQRVSIPINDTDKILGKKDARVTVVEFSDFQCPFCSRFQPTVKQLMQTYGDQVRWVFKQFPLQSIHENARPAAEASECAAEQGKFWEFSDKLFENQNNLSSALYTKLASDLQLNTTKFASCVSSRKYQQKVDEEIQQGTQAGVEGTPTSFVNGIPVTGALPVAQFKNLIDSELK